MNNIPNLKFEVDLTELLDLYTRAFASGDDVAAEAARIAVSEAGTAEAATIEMLVAEAVAQVRMK